MNSDILEKIINKDTIKRYSLFAFALLISAINYNLFILPGNIIMGGTNGIASILNHVFSLEPSMVLFLVHFIVLFVSIAYLSKEDTTACVFTMIVYPLLVKATTGINELFLISKDSILLFAIIGGILNGINNGMIYKIGLNTGGVGTISKVVSKKLQQGVSKINFIINIIIVLLGGYFFGISAILYSCILLYITNIVCEKILLGISGNKTFYIISKKYEEINDFITQELHHDATIFNVKGKYKDKTAKLIFCVVPTSEYFILKEGIKSIDRKAFITISDTYELKGQDTKLKVTNNNKW